MVASEGESSIATAKEYGEGRRRRDTFTQRARAETKRKEASAKGR